MKTETFLINLFYALVLFQTIIFVYGAFYTLFDREDFIPDMVDKKDTTQTFEKSKYYQEYQCWYYKLDTSRQNILYIHNFKSKECRDHVNEQTLASDNMELLQKLYRKDQSPCK